MCLLFCASFVRTIALFNGDSAADAAAAADKEKKERRPSPLKLLQLAAEATAAHGSLRAPAFSPPTPLLPYVVPMTYGAASTRQLGRPRRPFVPPPPRSSRCRGSRGQSSCQPALEKKKCFFSRPWPL